METLENLENFDNITENTSSGEFTFSRSDLDSVHKVNHAKQSQSGGGLFCNDEIADILLCAFSDARPDIACYLFCKLQKFPKDLTKVDENKKNILHHMTLYASHGNMVLHITKLFDLISKSKLKKALNCQDDTGSTPLHYATLLGFNNLVKFYIDNGADCSIRNNDGLFVEQEDNDKPVDVSVILATDSESKINYNMFNDLDAEIFEKTVRTDTMSPFVRDTINRDKNIFKSTSHLDTDKFIQEVQNEYKNLAKSPRSPKPAKSTVRESNVNPFKSQRENTESINTEQIVQQILDNVSKNKSESDLDLDTERILEDIMSQQNRLKQNQFGGKKRGSKKGSSKKDSKKARKGSKKPKKMSRQSLGENISLQSEISVSALSSDNSEISDIARQISRQSTDVHERTVQKIIKLLKLDENSQQDVQKARNYKAAIYRMIKEKNPLLNNFDRAVEMEKSITLELLKSIDITKVTKEIEKHLSEKSTSNASNTSTVSAKSVQKRIPEYNPEYTVSSATEQILNESSSISFSTISEF